MLPDVRGLCIPFPSGLVLSLRKNRAGVVPCAMSRGGEPGGDCIVGDVGGQEGLPEMTSGAVAGNGGGVAGSGVDGVELPPPPSRFETLN